MRGVYTIFLSTRGLTDFQVKPVYPQYPNLEGMVFMQILTLMAFRIRPEVANKSATGANAIPVQLVLGSFVKTQPGSRWNHSRMCVGARISEDRRGTRRFS